MSPRWLLTIVCVGFLLGVVGCAGKSSQEDREQIDKLQKELADARAEIEANKDEIEKLNKSAKKDEIEKLRKEMIKYTNLISGSMVRVDVKKEGEDEVFFCAGKKLKKSEIPGFLKELAVWEGKKDLIILYDDDKLVNEAAAVDDMAKSTEKYNDAYIVGKPKPVKGSN